MEMKVLEVPEFILKTLWGLFFVPNMNKNTGIYG